MMKILYFFESLWALLWGMPRNGMLLLVLPLHALMYPLLMTFAGKTTAIAFIEIYVFSAPVLALGLIVYLCILCRRKRMNRYLWTAATVWALYFASVVFLVVFTVLMAQAFRR